ncbi:MAG: hypothetical protein EOM20_10320, partial [Spartobacteria bacterium]|nr:hypothetical protein [Spartobacteria bacterium]
FDDTYLNFSSAVPPADSNDTGMIYWDDVGTLASGASTTLVVNFTAQATTHGLPETNIVTTAPTTPPDEPDVPSKTNDAPYEISEADYLVFKTLTSPAGRAAQVGETVTFVLTVTNAGDVAFVTLPLTDTFDDAYLDFLSAIPPADSNDTGIIYWDDLGALPVGTATTVTVNFTAQASTLSLSETNAVVAAPTTPPDEPDLPPRTNDTPYEISQVGYAALKTLISPVGRAAQVGETITFHLAVSNTGDVQLVTVPIEDQFDDTYLDFLSAVPPVDSSAAGVLSWTNAGPLPVGASTTLVVNFTAQASTLSLPETNTVITSPTTPPDEPDLPPVSNDVPYEISSAGYDLVKTLTSPAGRAAQVGETVTFNLLVTNTGDVQLVTIPVVDTFDDGYLSFVSAVPPADSNDIGVVYWDDAGPLAVGASTTLVVNFTALASTLSLPETNIVTAAPTTPPDEPDVPPLTNDTPYEISSAGYTLNKMLASPLGRAAQVGEVITFMVTVANTGDVQLTTIPINDTFSSAYLAFLSAVPPSDSSGPGTVAWTNVGPLGSGASTTLVVNFTALASTMDLPETNIVVTAPSTPPDEPDVPPATNQAPYRISEAGYTLAKTLLSPSGRAAQLGETVSFRIDITNTGDVALVTVPVDDVFDDGYLDFSSAIPPASSNQSNHVYWNNVGPLTAGSVTSLYVDFTAQASTLSLPETNTVITAPTTPPNQPTVPVLSNDAPYEISSAGYLLEKIIIEPTNRPGIIGLPIVFDLRITNTGDVELLTVPVTDTYNTVYIDFESATPTPDSSVPGTLVWNDVGPLPSGASTTLTVRFRALASTMGHEETNTVGTAPTTPPDEPDVPPQSADQPYTIIPTDVDLYKYTIVPPGRAAQVGEIVTFEIICVNTGIINIVSNRLVDTFDGSYLSYFSSTPPSSSNDSNHVYWDDIGPLETNAFTNVYVSFVALQSTLGTELTNWVEKLAYTASGPLNLVSNHSPYAISMAGYTLDKTLTAPTGRTAQVGETITFDLTIVNTGDVTLATVPLVDTYDDVYLDYVSALPPSSSNEAGVIYWDDIGAIVPGTNRVVQLTFTARNSTLSEPETNTVVSSPTTPPTQPDVPILTNEAPYEISRAGYTIEKVRTAPVGRAAQVGETVSFVVTIVNTGDVALVTVPVEDTFGESYLDFAGASPAVSSSGSGILTWDDVGPLATGASVTITIDFTAQASTQGDRQNHVETSPTTPPDEPAVPTLSDDAPYAVSAADYTIVKNIVSPSGRAAVVGEEIVFEIIIANAGDVTLVTVPLSDSYEATYLDYAGATPPPNNVGAGSLAWNNIGSINVGESRRVEVRFTAKATTGGQPHLNTVNTAPTTPPDEPQVPPKSADEPYTIEQPAAVGNFVWHDLNYNGIQDAGEPGMALVEVNLYTAGGTLVDSMDTDITGYYEFGNLIPGSYFVEVIHPAGYTFTLQHQGVDPAKDSDVNPLTGRTAAFTLDPGERDLTRDAGLYTLGSLAGAVYNDANDDGVQQVTEIPFANVRLVLYHADTGLPVATNVTDLNGDYLFTGLVPGNYYVEVDDPTLPPGFDLGAHFTDPSSTHFVASGSHVPDVDFGYLNTAGTAIVGDYVWSDTNGDGIQDPGESGIAGVEVSLIAPGPDGIFGTPDDILIATTITDGSGKYLFTDVEPGSYIVKTTEGPGTPLAGLIPVSGPQSYPGITHPFTVQAGDSYLTADFGYTGLSGEIGTLVFVDLNGNGRFDGADYGMPGVSVNLRNADGLIIATTVTDADGNYLFTGLAGGEYTVEVTDVNSVLAGLTHTLGVPNTDNESQVNPFTVLLPEGGRIHYADFGYAPEGGVIGNLVFSDINRDGIFDTGDGDAGIAGVRVVLYDMTMTPIADRITDANGQYLFTGLIGGEYFVQVDASTLPPGFATGPVGPNPGADNNSQQQPYRIVLPVNGSNLTGDFGYVTDGALLLGDEVFFDCNQNQIFDPWENGISGIQVTLYRDVNGDGIVDAGDAVVGHKVTDSIGYYLFSNLTAGAYIVDLADPQGKLRQAVATIGEPPRAINLTSDNLRVDFGFVQTPNVGVIGNHVWVDVNMNGLPDEDLTEYGLNGAVVHLYQVTDTGTNYLRSTTTQSGPGNERGFYQFNDVPYGEFDVVIDQGSIVSNLSMKTTPMKYRVRICAETLFTGRNFGFMNGTPTPVELLAFTAQRVDDKDVVLWTTAVELNNLGFNVYRSETRDGEKVRVNDVLIEGNGSGIGRAYGLTNAVTVPDAACYYWLEDVAYDFTSSMHGPRGVNSGNGTGHDYDADGLADVVIFDPDSGNWYILQSGTGTLLQRNWGWADTLPVPADYDGDGETDLAVYWPENGAWFISESRSGHLVQHEWGWADALPVPGDYDGDLRDDLAVYWPTEGRWYILPSSTGIPVIRDWGWDAATPVPGDYDGDGMTDVAVYWPEEGRWYVVFSDGGIMNGEEWGWADTLPVPADYDGDGQTDLAVFWPEGGMWYILLSGDDSAASFNWGWQDTLPAPDDYDGDGQADPAVYWPATGRWYIRRSLDNEALILDWGWRTSLPVTKQPAQR